ncbi:MAG: hypothetical protein JXA33_28535 [Anaerolineae bacterium]|nr:hypothetical protein [Anaerolineae bacterium]
MDPFAINVPPDILNAAYIERPEIEEQIYKPGNRIIVGVKGSGKTSLWQRPRPTTKDLSGRDVVFLRISPDILTSDCLARHRWDKKKSKILIDSTEHLSEQSLIHLVHTIQEWHGKTSGLLDFIVFVTPQRKALIEGLGYVEQGTLAISDLPTWEEPELRTLLGQRLAAWSIGFIDHESFRRPQKPCGIQNLPKFHSVLVNFNQFKSDAELRAVFVDSRIALWRSELPQASDTKARISQTIEYLWRCANKGEENGLILFLNVLCDLIDPEDIRKRQLGKLIKDLELEWHAASFVTEFHSPLDYALNWAKEIPNLADDETRREFISIIIKGVLDAEPTQEDWDAPIHALNLTRGFIAACAGCWPRCYPTPLGIDHLKSLVSIYWGKGEEK